MFYPASKPHVISHRKPQVQLLQEDTSQILNDSQILKNAFHTKKYYYIKQYENTKQKKHRLLLMQCAHR